MSKKRVMFSPVTRLSGLLSVELFIERGRVVEANASSTMLRGFEWIMRERHVTDAVYMTQRICGICSTAHGAVASYLLDDLYNNDLSENAQYLRNIMYGADILQNHIRHFYLFSLPDFVRMPDRPPFQGQELGDARLNPRDNRRHVDNYFEAIRVSQKCHQILALFGGKAPHQHSFLYGGVSVAPSADKVNRALALIEEIYNFVQNKMLPDTELISKAYGDYFNTGVTPGRLLSFGLFKFGVKNEKLLWRSGAVKKGRVSVPDTDLIDEDITNSWYRLEGKEPAGTELVPDPYKPGAYTWVIPVKYAGEFYEGGPLARMKINGFYSGGTSTMDRIYARSLETSLISGLIKDWLNKLVPGPPPLQQKKIPVKNRVISTTDAMRGPLLHSAYIVDEQVARYNIITPTAWNFSPKDKQGERGPVESALAGTVISNPANLYTVLGRIIRSFDPCINCATHVIDLDNSDNNEPQMQVFRI